MFYTDVDNRERARAKDKNQRRQICWKSNMRIYVGGQKMRNASGQQAAASKLKMSGSEKIANRNTSNKTFFSIKCVTEYRVVVVQNNGKEMYKKCTACANLLIRLLILAVFRRLALLDFIFCFIKL